MTLQPAGHQRAGSLSLSLTLHFLSVDGKTLHLLKDGELPKAQMMVSVF